jgi:uncharacterized protein involved in outer membrane biogenesis
MKKFLITITIVLIAIFALGIFSLNGIIKNGIETFAPQITKTDVTLDSANVSLFSGNGSLHGLVVGSPKGFKSDYVFSLSNISVTLDTGSLISDTIIIKEIIIDSPEIVYEISKSGININKLLDNAKGASKENTPSTSGGNNIHKNSKKVVIENIKIKSGKVTMAANLFGGSAPGASIPLPDIHIKDIGKNNGGTSFESALAKILSTVSKKVATLSINPEQLKDITDGAKGAIEGVSDKLKGLF